MLDCQPSVRAYDADTEALRQCLHQLGPVLATARVPALDAAALLDAWLVAADCLPLEHLPAANAGQPRSFEVTSPPCGAWPNCM